MIGELLEGAAVIDCSRFKAPVTIVVEEHDRLSCRCEETVDKLTDRFAVEGISVIDKAVELG